MTSPADQPSAPATAEDRTWRVEVVMPCFHEGKFAGYPVGWRSLNNLPSGVRSKGRYGDPPPRRLGSIDWNLAGAAWRLASFVAIAAARVPPGLGRVEVTVELRFPDQRERDPSNFELTIKPVIDALGQPRLYRSKNKKRDYGMVNEPGRGIIDTDAPRCLVRPNTIVGEPLGLKNPIKGMVIMHIRQLPAEEAAA